MSDISNKRIVIDVDDTLCTTVAGDYEHSTPVPAVVNTLREYKEKGYMITIYSSRNMRTYEGNIGKINANTLPTLLKFLDGNDIPYDEVVMGKPWSGVGGFYVDDRAVRPSEFATMSESEIITLLDDEKNFVRRC